MDPLTIAAISAGVGAASGKLVEKTWDAGTGWLERTFRGQEQTALDRARENSLEFLADLAQRVNRLEQDAPNEETKQRIQSAFANPDTYVLLRETFINSARTESDEKHVLLARIIAERLKADSDTTLALCSNLASRAVSNLTVEQTRCLAVAALVYHIEFTPGENIQLMLDQWRSMQLQVNLTHVFPSKPPIEVDLLHLQACGCVYLLPISNRDIRETLHEKLDSQFDAFMTTVPGQRLSSMWNAGISRIPLTSVGQMIGVYVVDELMGTRTTFSDWN